MTARQMTPQRSLKLVAPLAFSFRGRTIDPLAYVSKPLTAKRKFMRGYAGTAHGAQHAQHGVRSSRDLRRLAYRCHEQLFFTSFTIALNMTS
jgi:hypothetical protein